MLKPYYKGQSNSTACQLCLPGMICDDENGTVDGINCPVGYFCKAGLASTNDTANCSPGSFCLEKSSSIHLCDIGTFNPESNQSDEECQSCSLGQYCETRGLAFPSGNCSSGYYCPEGSELNNARPGEIDADNNYICPMGYECPEGVDSPIACGPGKYQPNIMSEECLICPAGLYCPELANTQVGF